MRIANAGGRLVVVAPDGASAVDVESASGGRFSSDVQAVYDRWGEFLDWAGAVSFDSAEPPASNSLESPVPRPRQVFGIGLNYRSHAAEANLPVPTSSLVVFTKFPSSITARSLRSNCPRARSITRPNSL